MRAALLLSILAVPLATASAQIAAYHDQTLAQHQAQISSLRGQGYRMVTVTSYGTAASPLFAAIWAVRSGPSWQAFSSVDATTYQNLFNTWVGNGYTVKLLSVHGSGSSTRYTGVFEVSSVPFSAAHDMTQAQFDDQCQNARETGFLCTAAAVSGTSGAPRFAGVWTRNDRNVDWSWTHSLDAASYQLHFNAAASGWLRPAVMSLSSYDRYLAIWYDNQLQNGWTASHDMTSADYQSAFTTNWNAGRYPILVTGAGNGSAQRMAAVYASSESIIARQFTTSGTAVAGLTAFDTYVRDLMQDNHVRSGSLAVVKDGRLMLARGYTWAEPGYPDTQPTSLFRIASIAKPITSIALHREMQRSVAVRDTRTFLSFLPAINPLDSRTSTITLNHLLSHAGGWDINMMGFDPQFHDAAISTWAGGTLPTTKNEIFSFMTLARSLNFTPGARSAYSNYGFLVLGEVLEALNTGMTYAQIVDRDVWTPLGLTRPRIGSSLLANAAAGEVRYHPRQPYIGQSVITSSRPWVPGQYGAWHHGNMDAHGGWIMATPDLGAVLASFDLGNQSPVINSSWTSHMFSTVNSAYANVRRGWFQTADPAPRNPFRVIRHHNGGLPGTSTLGVIRSDNVGFALFFNRDSGLYDNHGLALSAIADAVTTWPNHDLFPSVGIPSLRSRTTGTFAQFGTACAGSNGTPSHIGTGTPEIGNTMTLRLANGVPNSVALMFLGLSRSSWNGLFLPFNMGSLGATGCFLRTAPTTILSDALTSSGAGLLDLDVPNDVNLIGGHIYTQWAPLDLAANTFGLTFSNGLDTMLGGWQ